MGVVAPLILSLLFMQDTLNTTNLSAAVPSARAAAAAVAFGDFYTTVGLPVGLAGLCDDGQGQTPRQGHTSRP